MLSYRHSFHAGNFADVLKHVVLVELLKHMVKKDKPFEYIDTHSGAGFYNLESKYAKKLSEHDNGIGKLKSEQWPELAEYFKILEDFNRASDFKCYPGSPLIAAKFLRPKDKAWLYELHHADFALLETNIGTNRRIKSFCQDGLKGALAHVPPVSRRAVVLMDPSYEVKSDYDAVFKTIEAAHKKFSTGIYALWYPVVDRQKIDRLESKFVRSGIKDIQRFELGLSADTREPGMTASGMLVINPPWGLRDTMSKVLPRLVEALADDSAAFYKCDVLVDQ